VRLRRGERLLIASHNAGKVREMADLLRPYGLELVAAAKLGLPEPPEDGTSFAENARIKATAAARSAGLVALADDSGLEVEALNGAPGIYSARWAGRDKDFAAAMRRVAQEVIAADAWRGGPRANFAAALALARPDGEAAIFEGRVFGHLVWPPRGEGGFGYDPMFVADGETLTFGEMDPDAKHQISHRARAFAAFAGACLGAPD